MSSYPFICDIDLTKLHFGPMESEGGRDKVEVFLDASKKKLKYNLCEDFQEPFDTRYPIDGIRDDASNERRGQVICLMDEKVLAHYKALDELMLKLAFERSKEWFKGNKQLTPEEIKFRYQPLVYKAKEEDAHFSTKFKIKCPPAKVPSALHLLKDGKVVQYGCAIDKLSAPGGKMAPIIYVYSVWFMGGGKSFGLTVQAEEIVVVPGEGSKPLSKFNTKRPVTVVSSTAATGEVEDEEYCGPPPAKSTKVELEGEDGPM